MIVGFDSLLTYETLCRAAWFLRKGVPGFATHPDAYCPTDRSTWLVDCGAITACLECATGKKLRVLGKPDPGMLREAANRRGGCARSLSDDRGPPFHRYCAREQCGRENLLDRHGRRGGGSQRTKGDSSGSHRSRSRRTGDALGSDGSRSGRFRRFFRTLQIGQRGKSRLKTRKRKKGKNG